MYNELDELLLEEISGDSWYDDAYMIAQDIMNHFSDADWRKLSDEVLNKSMAWQKKLVYCLDNQIIEEELEIIGKLLTAKDDEMFELCIDVLRSFDNEIGHLYIKTHPEIVQEAKKRLANGNSVTQKVAQSFLQKLSPPHLM